MADIIVAVDEALDELERAGFEAEPFGQNTIAVKALPASVRSDDIEKLLNEIIETFERGAAPRYRPPMPTGVIRIDTS